MPAPDDVHPGVCRQRHSRAEIFEKRLCEAVIYPVRVGENRYALAGLAVNVVRKAFVVGYEAGREAVGALVSS